MWWGVANASLMVQFSRCLACLVDVCLSFFLCLSVSCVIVINCSISFISSSSSSIIIEPENLRLRDQFSRDRRKMRKIVPTRER